MQSTVVLSTKLAQPRLRKDAVVRDRLTGKCTPDLLRGVKLLLIAAPAGFGKTTLALQCLSRLKCRSGWLSLDEFDNNLRQFVTSLVSSLQSMDPGIGKQILPLLRGAGAPQTDQLVSILVEDLGRIPDECVIVLDDYHRVDDQQVHRALSFLLEHLPSHIHIMMTTRVDPMLPLPRLRVRNELIEVRERDLRFTLNEAEQFLTGSMGCKLSPADITVLAERTEGWIAGLQIAAVSLRASHDARRFIASFTGSNRYVVDYLLDEVFSQQPQEVQEFLVQTSILGQFNAELCDAVTDRRDSARILRNLDRANVFIIPLDENRGWYRYHPLFADLLQLHLQQYGPDRRDLLRERASRWYENHGEVNLAIEHSLMMTSSGRALELLDDHAFEYFQRSELAVLEKFLSRVPSPPQERYPMLLMVKAWVQLMTHHAESLQQTLSLVTAALQDPPSHYSPKRVEEVRAHMLTVRAFTLRLLGEFDESVAVSEKALASLPAEQNFVRATLHLNLGRIWMKRGWARKAIKSFGDCLAICSKTENYYVSLGALAHTGSQYAVIEPLATAQTMLEESLSRAEKEGSDRLPACGFILYQLGRVLYHRNELDRARSILQRAIALGEGGNEPDILHNALTMSALTFWASGDREGARRCMQKAWTIDAEHPIRIYEADAALSKAFLAMVDGDLKTLEQWIERERDLPRREFTTVTEFECTSLMYVFIRLKRFGEIAFFAGWLRKEAQLRSRTSAIGHADLYEGLALYALGDFRAALPLLKKALEFGAGYGWIRLFLSNGDLMREALQWFCKESTERSPARTFAEFILHSLDGRSVEYVPQFRQKTVDPLTEREQEVLHYLSRGIPNKEIARSMFISSNTLKTHIRRLFAKLGASDRAEALAKAKEAGIGAKEQSA